MNQLEKELLWLDLLVERTKEHTFRFGDLHFLSRNEDSCHIIYKRDETSLYYSNLGEALYMLFYEADK